jgi:aminoglycoside phosphotransferase (APT) family kinase protein
VAAGARRSRAELTDALTAWYRSRHPERTGVDLQVQRPSAGLSSETVLVDVTWPEGTESLVVRLPPVGPTLFPDYDLVAQAEIQAALRATDVPVPELVAMETDQSWTGAPFVVSAKVAGRTLATAPSYVDHGWFAEASADDRGRLAEGALMLMSRIHRLDPFKLGLERFSGGGPSLSGALDYWESYLAWATDDLEQTDIYRSALAWCRDNLPAPAPAGLLWGDPQLTNLIFSEQSEPVAVLDWEMSSLGPAEIDLAWFILMHEMACEQAGVANPPGLPDRAEMISFYERHLGRPVAELEWYEVFAHLRSGAIVVRVGELMLRAGVANTWTAQVPQPRHLRRLIGEGSA